MDNICSKKRAAFREQSSIQTVSYMYEEHITASCMSKDKYVITFVCQMEAIIVFMALQMCLQHVGSISNNCGIFPSFSWDVQ